MGLILGLISVPQALELLALFAVMGVMIFVAGVVVFVGTT